MRFVTDEESKKQYKKFLEENEKCNFQQSLEWAEVKKPNWIPEVILAEDEEKKHNRLTMCMDKKNTNLWKHNVCTKRTSM